MENVYKVNSDNLTFTIIGIHHPSNVKFPRMLNKYSTQVLETLKTDQDLKDQISDEMIMKVKNKTKNPDYFRDLYEARLIDEAKRLLRVSQ